jgi:anaerobic selenocysteine-containing dehydrogenase
LPKDNKNEKAEVSRRDFLVGAGAVVVSGAVGAGILAGCGTKTETVVSTSTKTVTSTVSGGGATATVTSTVTQQVGTATTTVTTGGGTVTKTVTSTVSGGGGGGLEPAYEAEITTIKRSNSDGRNLSSNETKNGKLVRIRPLHYDDQYTIAQLDPMIGARALKAQNNKTFDMPMKSLLSRYHHTFKKRIYSPNRILYPLQRVDWQPGSGDPSVTNPQNRMKSKFKRISWDTATTIIANEINRITQKYTPWAILCCMDAHGETKTIHAKHGCGMRLLRLYNNGYTQQMRNPDSWEGWYWGAKHFWGDGWQGQCKQVGPLYSDIIKNTKLCIYEGHDPATQVGCYFGEWPSLFYRWFQEAGGFVLSITPELNYDSQVKVRPYLGKWVPVYEATDVALHMAIAYTQIDEGLYDQEYLDTHSVGFDQYKAYIMGEEDGIPKTPAWAAPICGVTEWTIKAIARRWAAVPTTTCHREGGPQRGPYSHETARAEAYIMGM